MAVRVGLPIGNSTGHSREKKSPHLFPSPHFIIGGIHALWTVGIFLLGVLLGVRLARATVERGDAFICAHGFFALLVGRAVFASIRNSQTLLCGLGVPLGRSENIRSANHRPYPLGVSADACIGVAGTTSVYEALLSPSSMDMVISSAGGN